MVLQAKEMLDMANANNSENKKLKKRFSSGCIKRFKKLHNIRFRRIHGEAKSADEDAISAKMSRITNLRKD